MEANTLKYQYYAAICVNIASMEYGIIIGWTSVGFPVLQSETETPLEDGPMTDEDISWVGSILCIGALFGTVFSSWLAEKFGRKPALLTATLPLIMSWIFIMTAKSVRYLVISRFLSGFAGGGFFVLIPIYITEIAEDRIRGVTGSLLVLTTNFGILVAFIINNFLPYSVLPYIYIAPCFAFLLFFSFLPETPHYLLARNKVQESEKSLRFYRNYRRGSMALPENVIAELEKLKADFPDRENAEKQVNETTLSWKDFSNRIYIKALVIGIGLVALNQLSGCFAMINYTSAIFKQSGSNLSPNMSSIVVGIIQLLGSYLATLFVEKAGRKLLLIISAFSTSMCLLCLGVYTACNEAGFNVSAFKWIPVASFSLAMCVAGIGILPLPWVVISEVMPPKIRGIGCMICTCILWLSSFGVLKYYPVMVSSIGLHGAMFVFSACCIAGAIFVIVFVPETKGKSIEAIMKLL